MTKQEKNTVWMGGLLQAAINDLRACNDKPEVEHDPDFMAVSAKSTKGK
jgi:hypothetical protein